MKELSLILKNKNNYLNNIFKNKFILFSLAIFFSLLWVIAISHHNFDKGIDFTDSTLTYNFSLRILKGDIPFKDFHTFVTPLAFYIEAFFHKLFGENIIVNSYLGLFNKFLQTYLIYLILLFFTNNFTRSIIFSLFIMGPMGQLNETFFSFTPFATTLSLTSIYFVLLSISQTKYVFLFGIFIGLTFLTKQNFGIIILFAYAIYQIYGILYRKNSFFIALNEIIFCIVGIILVVLPFFLYFNSENAISEILYILSTGSERKGLTEVFSIDFFNSLIPFLNPKVFIPSIIIALWYLFISFKNKNKYFLITIFFISLLGFFSIYIGGQFRNLLGVFLYDSPKLLLPICLFYYCFLKKEFNKEIIIFLFIAFFMVFTNELSWPGRGPTTLTILTTLFILLFPLGFSHNFLDKKNKLTYKTVNLFTLTFNFLFGFFSIFLPKEYLRRDFNSYTTINLPPLLINRKTSSEHKNLILKARSEYNKYCKGQKSFIFPWAPILYHFIGSENLTRFDLPYHDWLTEKEADEIISQLESTPPCLLIVYQKSISKAGIKSPFEANPMRKIESFLKGGFLDNYTLIETLNSFSDKKIIFRRITP